MRFLNAIKGDIKFQRKAGFYILYALITIIYIVVIGAITDQELKRKVAVSLILSDPAAMGLFFMGAIVLLEKNQHIPIALAVSPLKDGEYVLAKVGSISVISTIVAVILALVSGITNILMVILGTILMCIIFSLLGLIIACKIKSLNQFIIATCPVEVVGFVPALLYYFGVLDNKLWRYYPSVGGINIIDGKEKSVIIILILIMVFILLFWASKRAVKNMWQSSGGMKL